MEKRVGNVHRRDSLVSPDSVIAKIAGCTWDRLAQVCNGRQNALFMPIITNNIPYLWNIIRYDQT